MKTPQQETNTPNSHIDIQLSNNGHIGALATGNNGIAITTIENTYKGFTPKMLQKPIEKILKEFHHGSRDIAKAKLETLQDLHNQDNETELALNIVAIYLRLIKTEDIPTAKQQLTTFLLSTEKTQSTTLIDDLCVAALIQLLATDNDTTGIEKLRKTYQSEWGIHAREIYYSSVADKDELLLQKNKLLTINDLRGLIEGSIRITDFNLAAHYINELKKQENTDLTLLQQVIVDLSLLQECNGVKTIWSITATGYYKLKSASKTLTQLLTKDRIIDPRVPKLCAGLLKYFEGFEPDEFRDACWHRIMEIENCDDQCGAMLRSHFQNDFSKRSEGIQNLVEASDDKDFAQAKIDKILNESIIPIEDANFLAQFAESKEIHDWLSEGGRCKDESKLGTDVANLYLQVSSVDMEVPHRSTTKITEFSENLLTHHSEKLTTLNPSFVLRLASNLTHIGLPTQAIKFINPLLPKEDYWHNPLLGHYMDALFFAEKFESLEHTINHLDKKYWNATTWHHKAHISDMRGDLLLCKDELETSLEKQFNPHTILFLINIMEDLTCSDYEITQLLESISSESLQRNHPYSPHVITRLFKYNLVEKAINIILDWFIENPHKSAITITNIFNGLIFEGITPELTHYKDKSGITGICFRNTENDEEPQTRLIVPEEQANSDLFISASSPLGKLLLETQEKDTFDHGFCQYKIENKLPAILATYHISLDLRHKMNDGNDSFHMFKDASNNPERLFKKLVKMLALKDKNSDPILSNQEIPLILRGNLLLPAEPVRAAIQLLADPEVPKTILPKIEDNKERLTSILLDIYTVAYLSITGIVDGLLTSKTHIYISAETKTELDRWLKERDGLDGGNLSLAENGKLSFTDSKIMRARTTAIAGNIKTILGVAEILPIKTTDLPHDLLRLREFVDSSVWSTIRLSSMHDIKWLCIDTNLTHLMNKSDVPVVLDCESFIVSISALTPFEEKKHGLFHNAYSKLPFPVMYKDIWSLCLDTEESSITLLAKMIRQYPQLYPDFNRQVNMMASLLLISLTFSISQGKFLGVRSLHDVGFPYYIKDLAYAIFYVVIDTPAQGTAEHKLALLIIGLEENLTIHSDNTIRLIWGILNVLLHSFITGHFLSNDAINTHVEQLSTASDSNNHGDQPAQHTLIST